MAAFARQRPRAILVVLALALGIVPAAAARNRTIAPPGNSGIGQYVESIPTAGGGQPTNTLHPHAGSHGAGGGNSGAGGGSGGSGGGSGGSGGGSGGSGAGGTVISAATAKALAAQGPDGAAAASLAGATAPSNSPLGTQSAGANASSPRSVLASLLRALTGSSPNGGLGPLLPIILIGSLIAAGALVLRRRRHTT
jgi:hypothetical protein